MIIGPDVIFGDEFVTIFEVTIGPAVEKLCGPEVFRAEDELTYIKNYIQKYVFIFLFFFKFIYLPGTVALTGFIQN